MTVLHPNQFQVDDAWLAFKLNDAPICTEQDGEFNCICLMDAASCFILGTAFVSVHESEPSELDVRRLVNEALAHTNKVPARLFLPTGKFQNTLLSEAQRLGVSVIPTPKGELNVFTAEARQGFRAHLQRGH